MINEFINKCKSSLSFRDKEDFIKNNLIFICENIRLLQNSNNQAVNNLLEKINYYLLDKDKYSNSYIGTLIIDNIIHHLVLIEYKSYFYIDKEIILLTNDGYYNLMKYINLSKESVIYFEISKQFIEPLFELISEKLILLNIIKIFDNNNHYFYELKNSIDYDD